MKIKINKKYTYLRKLIEDIPNTFDNIGDIIFKNRNTIKVVNFKGVNINIKSYLIPHFVNKFAYAYIRKSKAERSFLHAEYLLNMSVNTPEPIAFINTYRYGLLNKSYYLSIHKKPDFELRDILNSNVSDKENILRQFAQYTYFSLHQNHVNHLDYSPGNILITKKNGIYEFDLVDLNRIRFEKINFNKGLNNLSKLWADEKIMEIIGEEYAKILNKPVSYTIKKLIQLENSHKERVIFKQKMKRFFKISENKN